MAHARADSSGGRRMSLADALTSCFAEPLTVLGDSPSAEDDRVIHRRRTAMRRSRALLSMFGPLLEEEPVAQVRDSLRAAARDLGEVRDHDVLAGRVATAGSHLPPDVAASFGSVVSCLGHEREVARRTLLAGLAAPVSECREELLHLVSEPPWRPDVDPGRRARPAVRRLLRRRFDALVRVAAEVGPHPPPAALHEVRKKAKVARYSAEAAAPFVGAGATLAARAATELQDLLGELQDSLLAEQWLASIPVDGLDPRTAFAVGVVTGEERAAQRGIVASWPAAWEEAATAFQKSRG